MLKMVRREEKGFTLIELLIVVGIIGVLLAVAVAALTGFIGTGKTEAMLAEKNAVQTAIDAYMAKNNLTTITEYSGTPRAIAGTDPFSIYLRPVGTDYSKYEYTWSQNGTITAQQ
ncbi:MAG: type II secretion system protein [Chloroflexi bacterium]|nr:type II secretion system protein [Chloroflexota bacterium]